MKTILFIFSILIVSFLLTSKAFTDHEGWPHGKNMPINVLRKVDAI